MIGRRAFLLAVICLVRVNAAFAQPGTYGPVCAGLNSVAWCHQFDPGVPLAMAIDAKGNTYVASAPYVSNPSILTAFSPDGSMIYKAQFTSSVAFMAPRTDGMLWVLSLAGSLFQVDAQGNESPINSPYGPFSPYAACSDAAGDLYLAVHTPSTNDSIVKLNTAGTIVGVFAVGAYGKPTAIAVDSSGAVYVVGVPAAGFEATLGAYETAVPMSAFSMNEGYALKIASALDHVVYATLLYQGQADGFASPTAVGVDSAGNAYVGGSFDGAPDQVFPVSQIGLPLRAGDLGAYVLKLNPGGSALVWSDVLASGSVEALTVLPDGRVRALVALFPFINSYGLIPQVEQGEALFAISSNGGNIESSYFLGGITGVFQAKGSPNGFLAAAPGGPAPVRMLVATNSARVPAIFNDQATMPLLVSFSDPPPQADLSVSLSLVKPFVVGNGTVDVRITVSNNGPADAEGVQLRAKVTDMTNGTATVIGCSPGGVAICNAGDGALIPKLPSGTAMSIEFVYGYGCPEQVCAPIVNATVQALTSDANLANNVAILTVPLTEGFGANLVSTWPLLPYPLAYYRSDLVGYDGTFNINPPPTADPSLTVWVPIQTSAGNVWYFDSWADGNRDNPRTFDASNGIPASQGRMNFRAAYALGVDPGSLDLVALPGSAPLAQTVKRYPVAHKGSWTIGKPAASWLTVSAGMVNSTDGSVVVTGNVDVTGLAPGYYTTTFPATLAAAGDPEVSLDIPATLRILDKAPVIQASGFVNGASYQSGPPSSREIITIFGSGLGPPQLVTAYVPQAGSLPTSLAGTSVEFQGTKAELLYVQDQSIGAIVPNTIYDVPATVTVKLGGTVGPSVSIPAPPYGPGVNGTSYAPALFTSDSSGGGNLAAVNSDGTVNSPQNPAKRGSVVALYGTGSTVPDVCTGKNFGFIFPSSTLFPTSTSPVEAFLSGKPAYVLYSGTAPEATCGAQQFDVFIPEDSATGAAVPVQLGIPVPGSSSTAPYLWYTTQPGTTLAIQ